MRALLASLLGLATLIGGCDDPPPPPPPRPPLPPPLPELPPVIAPRALSAHHGFDLVVSSEGPVLLYAAAYADGAGIRMQPLTPQGNAGGNERVVVTGGATGGDIIELSAATGGGRIGVGYLERTPRTTRVKVTYGEDAGEAFAPPRVLGASDAPIRGPRGQVARAAAPDGRIQALWRGTEAPCEDGSSERCIPIHVSRVAPSPSERDGVALALPAPCEVPITGFAIAGDGSWYYGVCEATSRPTSIVYAITFEPRYAHAERLHPGCQPRGLSPFGEGVAVLARCEHGVQGTRLEAGGRALSHFDAPPSIGCNDATPVIEIGSVVAPLGAPRGDLEALLPETFVPAGAKAIWTGENVLVAQAVEHDVAIRRYSCQRGVFRRNDQE